jgi:protein ImuA
MPGLASHHLETLRLKIAALEKRPMLAEGAALVAQRLGAPSAANDTRLEFAELLAAPAGVLHEIFADEQQQGSVALGFALGLVRSLIGGERRAIVYLQLADETQELGLPYAIGLKQFGIDPDMLIIGRVGNVTELLWAMEEAISCRAVAGAIADIAGHPKALDFTVSRRLSLRTSAAGTSAFLLRYGREREASACKLRWRVSPAPSGEQAFDSLAPGLLRFRVEIEKKRLGSKLQRAENKRLVLDWTENGFVSAGSARSGAHSHKTAAVSRPQPAALGDRLSQAG